MIRLMVFSPDSGIKSDIPIQETSRYLQAKDCMLWLDIHVEPREDTGKILKDEFGFHPLAIDDALHESHHPKLDDWGEYLYITLHGVQSDPESNDRFITEEVDFFVGDRYLVTYQSNQSMAVNRVWESAKKDTRLSMHGIGRLLYRIIDEIAADFMPLLDTLDQDIEKLEDLVILEPKPILLEQVSSFKRTLMHLRRVIAPQREVIGRLSRGEFAQFSAEDRMYFRDVYDHLVRINDIIENQRDILGSSMEIYLSVVSNRLNDVMKVLTIITTFFMPLTFITGFFGMNYFAASGSLDRWVSPLSFLVIFLIMVAIPLSMYLWMRRHDWI